MVVNIKSIVKSNKYIYTFLLRSYYQYLHILKYFSFKKYVKDSQFKKKRNVFFLLEQEHGNLGDIAIGYAQKQLVSYAFPNYNLIGITESEYMKYRNYIKKVVKPNDIICLIGGGSIGDQYLNHEEVRRNIILSYKENKIISFPQSMYFSKSTKGNKELENSKKIYSMNRNLVLIARDKISYKSMKCQFVENKILITPDIVLYLNETKSKVRRKGAYAFLRSDVESVLDEVDKKGILSVLQANYGDVVLSDTVINRNVPREKVKKEFYSLLDQFRKAELVVTDRLHGMVFATITSTPCIVLSNYNHKIEGQFEWIKHLGYVKYSKKATEIERHIHELKNLKEVEYNNNFAINEYQKIIDELS